MLWEQRRLLLKHAKIIKQLCKQANLCHLFGLEVFWWSNLKGLLIKNKSQSEEEVLLWVRKFIYGKVRMSIEIFSFSHKSAVFFMEVLLVESARIDASTDPHMCWWHRSLCLATGTTWKRLHPLGSSGERSGLRRSRCCAACERNNSKRFCSSFVCLSQQQVSF